MSKRKLSEKFSTWAKLEQHCQATRERTLAELFAQDGNRAARFSVSAAGLQLDYSKNHLCGETLQLLLDLSLIHI